MSATRKAHVKPTTLQKLGGIALIAGSALFAHTPRLDAVLALARDRCAPRHRPHAVRVRGRLQVDLRALRGALSTPTLLRAECGFRANSVRERAWVPLSTVTSGAADSAKICCPAGPRKVLALQRETLQRHPRHLVPPLLHKVPCLWVHPRLRAPPHEAPHPLHHLRPEHRVLGSHRHEGLALPRRP